MEEALDNLNADEIAAVIISDFNAEFAVAFFRRRLMPGS